MDPLAELLSDASRQVWEPPSRSRLSAADRRDLREMADGQAAYVDRVATSKRNREAAERGELPSPTELARHLAREFRRPRAPLAQAIAAQFGASGNEEIMAAGFGILADLEDPAALRSRLAQVEVLARREGVLTAEVRVLLDLALAQVDDAHSRLVVRLSLQALVVRLVEQVRAAAAAAVAFFPLPLEDQVARDRQGDQDRERAAFEANGPPPPALLRCSPLRRHGPPRPRRFSAPVGIMRPPRSSAEAQEALMAA